jgi:hypothetical protein
VDLDLDTFSSARVRRHEKILSSVQKQSLEEDSDEDDMVMDFDELNTEDLARLMTAQDASKAPVVAAQEEEEDMLLDEDEGVAVPQTRTAITVQRTLLDASLEEESDEEIGMDMTQAVGRDKATTSIGMDFTMAPGRILATRDAQMRTTVMQDVTGDGYIEEDDEDESTLSLSDQSNMMEETRAVGSVSIHSDAMEETRAIGALAMHVDMDASDDSTEISIDEETEFMRALDRQIVRDITAEITYDMINRDVSKKLSPMNATAALDRAMGMHVSPRSPVREKTSKKVAASPTPLQSMMVDTPSTSQFKSDTTLQLNATGPLLFDEEMQSMQSSIDLSVQSEQDLTPIPLADFLEATGMSFVSDTFAVKRRETLNVAELAKLKSSPTAIDYMIAHNADMDENEMYKYAIHEMEKDVAYKRTQLKDLESKFEESTPAFFYEYRSMPPQQQKQVQVHLVWMV